METFALGECSNVYVGPLRVQTLASVVLDLGSLTMWASDGPAAEAPYQKFALTTV